MDAPPKLTWNGANYSRTQVVIWVGAVQRKREFSTQGGCSKGSSDVTLEISLLEFELRRAVMSFIFAVFPIDGSTYIGALLYLLSVRTWILIV